MARVEFIAVLPCADGACWRPASSPALHWPQRGGQLVYGVDLGRDLLIGERRQIQGIELSQ
jgi:hypothetical protein